MPLYMHPVPEVRQLPRERVARLRDLLIAAAPSATDIIEADRLLAEAYLPEPTARREGTEADLAQILQEHEGRDVMAGLSAVWCLAGGSLDGEPFDAAQLADERVLQRLFDLAGVGCPDPSPEERQAEEEAMEAWLAVVDRGLPPWPVDGDAALDHVDAGPVHDGGPLATGQTPTATWMAPEVAACLAKPDAGWTADDLRAYVMAAIDHAHGPQLPGRRLDAAAVISGFWSRFGPERAVAIARDAFEGRAGFWMGAPVTIRRFTPGHDKFFAEPILAGLDGHTDRQRATLGDPGPSAPPAAGPAAGAADGTGPPAIPDADEVTAATPEPWFPLPEDDEIIAEAFTLVRQGCAVLPLRGVTERLTLECSCTEPDCPGGHLDPSTGSIWPLQATGRDLECTCGKPDCGPGKMGRHPRVARCENARSGWSWFPLVCTTEDQVREVFSQFSGCNLAVVTGWDREHWVICLDIDHHVPDEDGNLTWAGIQDGQEPLPATREDASPRDGRHVFLRLSPEDAERASQYGLRTSLGPGVEVKRNRQYMITPPSVSGFGPYRLISEAPLAVAPPWLADLLIRPPQEAPARARNPQAPRARDPQAPRPALPAAGPTRAGHYLRRAVERACETIAGQLEPGRNETLNDEAYSLGRLMAGLLEMEGTQAVAEEWDDDTVTGLLIDAAMDAGLPFGEAEGTTWSGFTAGLRKPKKLPDFGPEKLRRHARIPGLRVPEPPELAAYADEIFREQIAVIDEAVGEARACAAAGGEWEPKGWLDPVEPASKVLGGLGDLDLIASRFAWMEIVKAASPEDYLDAACADLGEKQAEALRARFCKDIARRFAAGWNEGAEAGHEVPADLRPVLEAWHPPCPIPREEIEPRRLPPGRDGCWPVRNMVSPADDRGNSARLLDHHGEEILFVGAAKGLGEHAFDGKKWIDGNAARELALQMCDDVIENLPVTEAMSYSVSVEVNKEGLPRPCGDRDEFLDWLAKQQSHARKNNMLSDATRFAQLRVTRDVFDADPLLYNCAGDVVDMLTGDTRPVRPSDRLMLYSPVSYRPDWPCPMYEAYLKRAHPGDTLALLDALDGYSACGLMDEEAFVIHYGEGTNGKSVYAKVKRAQHGSYLQVIPQKTLLTKRGDGVPNDIMRLRSKRFGITSETAEGKRLDEAVIKGIASGDPIVARFLFGEYEEFQPVIKMHLLTNKLPHASNTRSMRRRGWVVPWDVIIPPAEIDKTLPQKIIERELPGVQARTMRNFRQWRHNGFPASPTAEEASRNWLADQDAYHRFAEEVLDRTDDADAYVLPADLWNAWQTWTNFHGIRLEIDDATLFQALEEHGFARAKRNVPSQESKSGRSNKRVFTGIRLRAVTR